MIAHWLALVRDDAHIRARPRRAYQDESGFAVLRKAAARVGVIPIAFQRTAGASEVPAHFTRARKIQTRPTGGVENVLADAYKHGALAAVWKLEGDRVAIRGCRTLHSSSTGLRRAYRVGNGLMAG